jgi:hypothetical protein
MKNFINVVKTDKKTKKFFKKLQHPPIQRSPLSVDAADLLTLIGSGQVGQGPYQA